MRGACASNLAGARAEERQIALPSWGTWGIAPQVPNGASAAPFDLTDPVTSIWGVLVRSCNSKIQCTSERNMTVSTIGRPYTIQSLENLPENARPGDHYSCPGEPYLL